MHGATTKIISSCHLHSFAKDVEELINIDNNGNKASYLCIIDTQFRKSELQGEATFHLPGWCIRREHRNFYALLFSAVQRPTSIGSYMNYMRQHVCHHNREVNFCVKTVFTHKIVVFLFVFILKYIWSEV
jgi:hypothetical protein